MHVVLMVLFFEFYTVASKMRTKHDFCFQFCKCMFMEKKIPLFSTMYVLLKGCFTIRVHLQKLHSSSVLTVEAYFDFKVLLSKH